MRIFYIGAPGKMGGANTEMGHTVAVWRRTGIDVSVIPTWNIEDEGAAALRALGCEVHIVGGPGKISEIPGIAGSIFHSMCNGQFWVAYPTLKHLGCKTVWSSAMTFEYADALNAFTQFGLPDAFHYQSEFQKIENEKLLAPFRYKPDSGHVIRGAFDFNAVPFNPLPHAPNSPFIIGRLSRPDPDKWSKYHWPTLERVPYPGRRALCMGVDHRNIARLGPAPTWAECLTPLQISTVEFLNRCHAMMGLNGEARENWPRIGLESMAAGVPLVCENKWGWREMIIHGKTGFLCDTPEDFQFYLGLLARCEETRKKIIVAARAHVADLADEKVIGRQWLELFQSLGA